MYLSVKPLNATIYLIIRLLIRHSSNNNMLYKIEKISKVISCECPYILHLSNNKCCVNVAKH